MGKSRSGLKSITLADIWPEKIQKRLNKIDYSLNKKVDFDNYLRVLNKLNKTVKKEEDQDEINRQFILYS